MIREMIVIALARATLIECEKRKDTYDDVAASAACRRLFLRQ